MKWLLDQKDTIQLFANIAIILTLVFTAIQVTRAIKEYKVKNKTEEAKESIELTKYYMDNILDDIGLIRGAYKEFKLEDLFKKIKYTDIHNFDIHELEDIFSAEEIETIEEKLKSIDRDIVKKIIDNSEKAIQEIATTIDTNLEIEKHPLNLDKIGCININTIKSGLLNKLEYFSMKFNVNIADEELVYQSLHQTYLSVVKLLYYDISIKNKKNRDKYYINIIELYNKWAERYGDTTQKEERFRNLLVKKPKKIKK